MSGQSIPKEVTAAGVRLAVDLVRVGRDPREATMTAVHAWADLPVVEGRWLTATAATWMASHLLPELLEEGDRQGVDLRPWFAETLTIATASLPEGRPR